MFTPTVRLILIIFGLILSYLFYTKDDFVSMSLMLISVGLFIYGYFRYGTVYAAFQQLKKNNVEKAEKLISKIKDPSQLNKKRRSYYYFTTGIIALEKKDFDKSQSDLNRALEIGLKTDNDTSIVLLNLANIELMRKDYNKATSYIESIRQLRLKPSVESETNRIEKEIIVAQQHELLKK